MRGLRSFAGLLVVLLALGAYLYFVESKRTPSDAGEKREKVFAVEADAIDELTIKSEAGDITTLKKSGSDWQIVAPAAAPADAAEVSGITTNLSNLEQQRLIEENPSDLNPFGLAEPRLEIVFKSGEQEHRLLIGARTPIGSDLYARIAAASRVFLIPSYLDSTFNRSTFDLRDKRALSFDRDNADAIEIATAGRTTRFARANNEWRIAEPVVSRTDAAAIEGLLARINSLQMKKVAAAEPGELKTYGLDTPAATVRIGSGSSHATLLLGTTAEEGEIYAKDGARPAVFTVESTLLDDLRKDAGEYRQKDIFDARAFNTTRLEVARGGVTTVFEKATGDDGATWRQTAPEAKDADRAKVDALLSALTAARADSFVPVPPSGAATEATFTLTFDGRQERVALLKAGSDAYASRDGAVAKIGSADLDGILKALKDLE
ncbi:hypothetical protein BH24ACI5_BH24ACI5_12480 [soil metagenome]